MKSTKCLLKVGGDYEFFYPLHNLEFTKEQSIERRRIRVAKIQLVKTGTLKQFTKQLAATLIVGQRLITGIDLDKGTDVTLCFEKMSKTKEIIYKIDPFDRYETRLVSADKPDEVTQLGIRQNEARSYAGVINRVSHLTGCKAEVVQQRKAQRKKKLVSAR